MLKLVKALDLQHWADTDIVALEIPYILMSAEEINDWRIYKMIIENPHYLFEMIDYAFYSDDPEQKLLANCPQCIQGCPPKFGRI